MSADELVAWLTAQLDTDEQTARDACHGTKGHWRRPARDPYGDAGRIEGDDDEVVVYDEGSPTPLQADHIIRHDPARVLAEVDAKRRILNLHYPVDGRVYSDESPGDFKTVSVCAVCSYLDREEEPADEQPYPCLTVRLLALPHAGHPGWREEWRPA